MLYFGLSSVWGFLAGSVAVLVAFDAVGHPITLRGELGTALSIAAVLAVVGGVIVSMAYRELAGRR